MMTSFNNIDLDNIKGILIDLDDTLYKYNPAHEYALDFCYKTFIKKYKNFFNNFDEFSKSYREKRKAVTKRLFNQGSCRSRLFAFQSLFEELNITNNFDLALKYEKLYWKKFISVIKIEPFALNFLRKCQKLKLPVCIVSDMQANFQIMKIKKLKITKLINFLVTSEEVGAEKPNPKIFNFALNKLQLNYSDVIMIGDSVEKDIIGAKNLEIKTYKINLYEEGKN